MYTSVFKHIASHNEIMKYSFYQNTIFANMHSVRIPKITYIRFKC